MQPVRLPQPSLLHLQPVSQSVVARQHQLREEAVQGAAGLNLGMAILYLRPDQVTVQAVEELAGRRILICAAMSVSRFPQRLILSCYLTSIQDVSRTSGVTPHEDRTKENGNLFVEIWQ